MSPDKQRIAIAEACGWKRGYTGTTHWVCDPHGIRRGWSGFVECADNALPDYLNDLNAMHEAINAICEQKGFSFQETYTRVLRAVVTRRRLGCNEIQKDYWLAEATAAQRAEAFLKTLGKWEGGK